MQIAGSESAICQNFSRHRILLTKHWVDAAPISRSVAVRSIARKCKKITEGDAYYKEDRKAVYRTPLKAKEPIRKGLYRWFFYEGRNLRMGLALDRGLGQPRIYESRNLRMGLAPFMCAILRNITYNEGKRDGFFRRFLVHLACG